MENQCDVVAAPEWLLKLIIEKQPIDSNGKRKGKPLEEWHLVLTNPIVDGTRNETIASICGKLLHCDVNDPVLMLDILCCVDRARCQPPLGEREVTHHAHPGKTNFAQWPIRLFRSTARKPWRWNTPKSTRISSLCR